MKKLALLLALSLALCLAACGETTPQNVDGGKTDTDSAVGSVDTEDTADTPAKSERATYTVKLDNGATVVIGGDSDSLIKSLGEPIGLLEAPSCVHEGFDRVYSYDGFSITTSPAADKTQYVAELAFLSDAVAMDSGLTVGSEAALLDSVLGTEYEEQFGIRRYTPVEGITATVVLDGDVVSGLSFSPTGE